MFVLAKCHAGSKQKRDASVVSFDFRIPTGLERTPARAPAPDYVMTVARFTFYVMLLGVEVEDYVDTDSRGSHDVGVGVAGGQYRGSNDVGYGSCWGSGVK